MTVFQTTIKKLSVYLVFCALAASAFSQERNSNDAVRKAVPVENYTTESWLGQYFADNAPDEIYGFFLENPNYALYAKAYGFGEESKYCLATIGLTEATKNDRRSPRLPKTYYLGASTNEKTFEGKDGCYGKSLKEAASRLFKDELQTLIDGITPTKNDEVSSPKLKKDNDIIRSSAAGISDFGKQFLRDLHPKWFPYAIDHRYHTVRYNYYEVKANNGNTVCVASYGLNSRTPDMRNARHPVAAITIGKIVKTSAPTEKEDDSVCFDPLWTEIISKLTPESKIFEVFVNNWDAVAELGIPAPTMKSISAGYNTWNKEQARKIRQDQQQQQKSITRNRSNLSCSNECYNGSCIRTFTNGQQERWQAPRTYNILTKNWEWDISTNACGG